MTPQLIDEDSPFSDEEISDEGAVSKVPRKVGWSPEGKEDLSNVQRFSISSRDFVISREGIPLKFTIPQASIFTNIPAASADELSLNDKVFCAGISSERNKQNREYLEKSQVRVVVCDYGKLGRVVLV